MKAHDKKKDKSSYVVAKIAKQMREMLKNKKMNVTAKAIAKS